MNIKDILFVTKNFTISSLKIILKDNDVSIDIKERCYEKILKDYEMCYNLRLDVDFIPENIKRRIEEKCLENPKWAYFLRRDVKDLPEDVKRRAEEKCCEDPHWAYHLIYVKKLQKGMKKKALLKCYEGKEIFFTDIDIKHLLWIIEEKIKKNIFFINN